MKRCKFFLLIFISFTAFAQKKGPEMEILTKGTKTSLRGLSVVDNNTIWVSGSGGTVGHSTDGGKTWAWTVVKGFEKTEFRDIEAFSATKAIIMAIDSPAYILKTIDGGESWRVVYQNNTKGMFLDAMEFWNEQAGIVVGDPIGGRLFVARTFDEGNTWQEVPMDHRPLADNGEAMFASSGTNVRALDKDEAVIVTGGLTSNIFIRDSKTRLPLLQGKETTGANSIAVLDNKTRKGGKTMMVVGGDFMTPNADTLNCFYTTNRGKTWKAPRIRPHGYRSCVEYISKNMIVATGINGSDYSTDGGATWAWFSKEGFNACRKAKDGTAVFFAGNGGKVGKLIIYTEKRQKRQ